MRARSVQSGLRALTDQVAVELGKCAELVKGQLATARPSVDVFLQAAQPDLGCVEPLDWPDQVLERPTN